MRVRSRNLPGGQLTPRSCFSAVGYNSHDIMVAVAVTDQTVTQFGQTPPEIAANIVARRPELVRLDLDLRLPGRPRTARDGLRIAAWLRANPACAFPVLGYSVVPERFWVRESLFLKVFGSGGVDLFGDRIEQREEPGVPGMVATPMSAAHGTATALLREVEPEYRHRFLNLVAAVRLLLGAMRAGGVDPQSGAAALGELAARLAQRPDSAHVVQLIDWYAGKRGSSPEQPAASLRGRKVLLIDDQAEALGWNIVFRAIFGEGYQGAETWASAKPVLATTEFDLALVDLDLGTDDGLKIIAHLRAERFELPVIAFSAYDRAELAIEAQRCGADFYFAKQLEDSGDRDSEDYFRRFARLVTNLPRFEDWSRKVWRRWEEIERKLDAWERARAGDASGSLRAGDLFRMAYYFATSRRPNEEGNVIVDFRHRTLFDEPLLAEASSLHLAFQVLTDRWLDRPDARTSPMVNLYDLGRTDDSKLKRLANPKHLHKVYLRRDWDSAAMFSAWLDLLNSLIESRPVDFASEAPQRAPIDTERPPLAERSDHGRRREAALAALKKGRPHRCDPLHLTLVAIDDQQPVPWVELLKDRCTGGVAPVAAGDRAVSEVDEKLRLLALNRKPPAAVLLDLDWSGSTTDAMKALRRMKATWPWLPVVVASAVDHCLEVQKALKEGAAWYFLLRPAKPHGESGYWKELWRVLEHASWLAGLGLNGVWRELQQVLPLPEGYPDELRNGCTAALRLAFFCAHPEYNPAEYWRVHRLLGLRRETREYSAMLRRFAYFLSFRALEAVWGQRGQGDTGDAEYGSLYNLRNTAVHNEVPGRTTMDPERELAATPPGVYLDRVLRKLNEIIERPAARP